MEKYKFGWCRTFEEGWGEGEYRQTTIHHLYAIGYTGGWINDEIGAMFKITERNGFIFSIYQGYPTLLVREEKHFSNLEDAKKHGEELATVMLNNNTARIEDYGKE